jgi:hypothetical protein
MKNQEAVEAAIHGFIARMEWYREELNPYPLFIPPPGGRPGYRRMAARLRAGKLESPHPELTAEEFADYLDLCVEQAELKQQLARELFAFADFLEKAIASALEDVYERCVATYKAAKVLAKEHGPDSCYAEFCRVAQPIFRKMQAPHGGRGRCRSRGARGSRPASRMNARNADGQNDSERSCSTAA